MRLKKGSAVALLVSIGFQTAAKWVPAKLVEKLKKIPELLDDDVVVPDDQQKLLDAVVGAVEAGDDIEVLGDDEVDEDVGVDVPKPTKKGKAKGKAKVEEDEEDEAPKPTKKGKAKVEEEVEEDEDPKPTKKGPKSSKSNKDGKTPGVIHSIIEFLKAGSKARPVTKQDIIQQLHARFPDRSVTSMTNTVNIQVPNRLRVDRDITVHKNDKGYWVNPDHN